MRTDVKPTLNANATIALVGEHASVDDLAANEFFSGSTRRVLDKACGLANIALKDLTLTAVSKTLVDPGTYVSGSGLAERLGPLENWMNKLKAELELHRPNVVVALGEEALFALTDKRGITKYRGSILPSTLVDGLKVIPALPPQWLLRGQFQHFWSLVGDLTRAEKQSHFPQIIPPTWESITSPSHLAACDFINGIGDNEKWSLDIETRAQHVACFSIAYANKAMCIAIQNPGGPAHFPNAEASIWKATQQLMARNPFLIGQNLTFDLEYLFDYGLEPSGIFMDTMISHAVLYPEFPKGLDFLCALYTEMPYYKSEGKITNPKVTTQDLWTYNNKDTITTLWCALEIEKELKKRNLWQCHEFVTKELGLALEMQRSRMNVDQDKRAELKVLVEQAQRDITAKWETKYNSVLAQLAHESPIVRPNVNSPKQMSEFLYKKLGLPAKTRQGSVVADEQAISELKAKYPNLPELDWITDERHLRKLEGSYLNVKLEDDGTIGGSWCVHGTETGRWSSGKNSHGRGLNLQTVPKAVRWMMTPKEDNEEKA